MHSHPPPQPPSPGTSTGATAWFTGLSFAPVPFVVLLYGIDGLILPALDSGGGHLPFAIGTAALAGLFLASAARDRRECRPGFLLTSAVMNFLCAMAALFAMFAPLGEIRDQLESRGIIGDCGCE